MVHLKKYIIICVCARVFVLFLKSFKRPELESSFKKRILDLSSLVFINRPSKYYPWQIFFFSVFAGRGQRGLTDGAMPRSAPTGAALSCCACGSSPLQSPPSVGFCCLKVCFR